MSFISSLPLLDEVKKRRIQAGQADPDQERIAAPIQEGGTASYGGDRIEAQSAPAAAPMPDYDTMRRISPPTTAPVSTQPVDSAGSYSLPGPNRAAPGNMGYNPPTETPMVGPPRIAPSGMPGEAPGVGVPHEMSIYERAGGPPPVSAVAELKHPKGFWGKLGQTLGRIGEGALIGSQYGGLGGAIYGAVHGGVKPNSIAQWKDRNILMPKWEAQRDKEIKEYQQQQAEENVKADNARADRIAKAQEELHGWNREDRIRGIKRQETEDIETRAKEEYNRAQEAQVPVDPARVKGSTLENQGGKTPPPKTQQKPEYRDVGGNLVRIKPDGSVESIYSAPPKPETPAEFQRRQTEERQAGHQERQDDQKTTAEFEKRKAAATTAAQEYDNLSYLMANPNVPETDKSGKPVMINGKASLLPVYKGEVVRQEDVEAARARKEATANEFHGFADTIKGHPRLELDESGQGIRARRGQGSTNQGGLGPASSYRLP